ncbi:MAG: PASTA domain-containing protein [Syntrophorhabdales bacterium]|jgi:serine/threonine-protein kinase
MMWFRMPFYALVGAVVFVLATSLTIRLLLRDESTVICPDLAGIDLEEAKRVAAQVGLSVVIGKYETKKDVPYNHVVRQMPDASIPVKVGRIVTVVLSDGPVPVIIPEFIGIPLDQAKVALQEHGMRLKKVIYVPAGNPNQVLAQSPGGGENILDPEGVILFVGGRGKRFYLMPDLAGVDRIAIMREMEEKRITYSLPPALGPDGMMGGVLRSRIPPRMIFSDDDMVELQISDGG